MSALSPSPALREASAWLYDSIAAEPGYHPQFEFLRSALGQGKARAGIGRASGECRAPEAAKLALEVLGELDGVGFLLANITASEDLSMQEFSAAALYLEEAARVQTPGGPDMEVSMTVDDSFNDELRIILIATDDRMR